MKNKLFIQFLLGGAIGALLFWLIIEPWKNDYGFLRDWMILFFVALGITLGLTTLKYIMNNEFSGILYLLKKYVIYIVLLGATLLIKLLFMGSPVIEKDTLQENRVLLLDTSGSMRGTAISKLKAAVSEYLDILKKSESIDEVGCVTFDTYTNVLNNQSNQYDDIILKTRGIYANGGTKMLQGIQKSIDILNGSTTNIPKEIILVSDGIPEQVNDVINYVQTIEDVKVSTIGVGRKYDRRLLEFIAQTTGGQFFPANNVAHLMNVFQDLGGLTRKSSLPWWKVLLGWTMFGSVISALIAYLNRCTFKEAISAIIPGGLIGGFVSSIFFLLTTAISSGSNASLRGVSFVILGLIIGTSIYLTIERFVKQNPEEGIVLKERVGGLQFK